MTLTDTAKSWISEVLKVAGFRGRGSVWRLNSPEVQWVVHIDALPYGNRLGIDIGLDLQSATARRRPTDCPVLLHIENLPVTSDLAVVESLDLDSRLELHQRRQEIENATWALARYVTGHLTLKAVRAAYHAGDLGSAFIHKDARAFLEAGYGS